MNTYKVGDKVIIRKDLLVGVECGTYWYELVEFMENYDYGVIDKVDSDGDYWLKGYDAFVTEEMIEGLYEEEKEMNNISNTMEPKKLHVVELKNGKVLEVPFGKLVIVIDTFAKKDLEKCLNRDDTVLVLGSEIKLIQNVEV